MFDPPQLQRLLVLGIVGMAMTLAACPQDVASHCDMHSDCKMDQLCVAQVCRQVCNYNLDCAQDERCFDGICLPSIVDAGNFDSAHEDHSSVDAHEFDGSRADASHADVFVVDSASSDLSYSDQWPMDTNLVVDSSTSSDAESFDHQSADGAATDAQSDDAAAVDMGQDDGPMSDAKSDAAMEPSDAAISDANRADSRLEDIYVAPCGNGVRASDEGCDDGNTESGDGCSALCQVESGWSCTSFADAPSICCINGEQDNDHDGICAPACGSSAAPNCVNGVCDDSSGQSLCLCNDFFAGETCADCVVYVSEASTLMALDGKTWDSAFHDVQQGLEFAKGLVSTGLPGCTVRLGQGQYNFSAGLGLQLKSAVTLRGGYAGPGELSRDSDLWDPEIYPSVLTGNPPTERLITAISDSRLEGCTMQGGGLGAVNVTDFVVDSCRFVENLNSSRGAAMQIVNAAVSVSHSHFIGNHSDAAGGAISVSDGSHLMITDSLFVDNNAVDFAGAVAVGAFSDVQVARCLFASNVIYGSGGALALINGGSVQVESSLFAGNEAIPGGGIDNTPGSGGGIRAFSGAAMIHGSTFMFHQGVIETAVSVGPSDKADSDIVNSVFYNNDPSGDVIDMRRGSVRDSLVQGGAAGMRIISSDPRFIATLMALVASPAPVFDTATGITTLFITTSEVNKRWTNRLLNVTGTAEPVFGAHYFPVLSEFSIDGADYYRLSIAGDVSQLSVDAPLTFFSGQLQDNSPCVDYGNSAFSEPDLLGRPRVCESSGSPGCPDLGAYESMP